ncbi:MAG: ROK family protein [Myxococcaceae bacterium]|nr:ROK family protein [Myxococcaceae bacterium]MCI0672386.1 ROK family protein [Myxococcaceae bacterium]
MHPSAPRVECGVSAGICVGVDLGATKALLVATGSVEPVQHRVPTGPRFTPAECEAEVRRFVARLPSMPVALGVAVPGLVDGEGRVVASDGLPSLGGWRPAEALADLGCPVVVLNDARAALAAETHDVGAGATAGVIMAGTAVGAAFLVNGVTLEGARGWAGELGHLPVVTGDGRVLHLDAVAGGGAVAARLGTDGAGLAKRAGLGDVAALSAIREAGAALGLGLAAVVNLLNPELLVLGGGAFLLPGYLEAALSSARMHAISQLWECCTVRPARTGAAVAALGAARVARVARVARSFGA